MSEKVRDQACSARRSRTGPPQDQLDTASYLLKVSGRPRGDQQSGAVPITPVSLSYLSYSIATSDS